MDEHREDLYRAVQVLKHALGSNDKAIADLLFVLDQDETDATVAFLIHIAASLALWVAEDNDRTPEDVLDALMAAA